MIKCDKGVVEIKGSVVDTGVELAKLLMPWKKDLLTVDLARKMPMKRLKIRSESVL